MLVDTADGLERVIVPAVKIRNQHHQVIVADTALRAYATRRSGHGVAALARRDRQFVIHGGEIAQPADYPALVRWVLISRLRLSLNRIAPTRSPTPSTRQAVRAATSAAITDFIFTCCRRTWAGAGLLRRPPAGRVSAYTRTWGFAKSAVCHAPVHGANIVAGTVVAQLVEIEAAAAQASACARSAANAPAGEAEAEAPRAVAQPHQRPQAGRCVIAIGRVTGSAHGDLFDDLIDNGIRRDLVRQRVIADDQAVAHDRVQHRAHVVRGDVVAAVQPGACATAAVQADAGARDWNRSRSSGRACRRIPQAGGSP